ncbi:MAG: toprim domain-containing protein [Verrucomicrobiae bacterium]|nr:toprim domain-containing protein [Verrucomicrobiae bacterium]
MSTIYEWIRVTKQAPCPCCGKPDWCTVAVDHGLACCMRIQSDRPAKNGGWLHKVGETLSKPVPRQPPAPVKMIDFASLWRIWWEKTSDEKIGRFASGLGVSSFSLLALGCCWTPEHNAWAFPMKDNSHGIIGIRLRNDAGKKWAVRGSHAGLFIPEIPKRNELFICEGPTDCAAAISLGIPAIGRPSCMGNEKQIADLIMKKGVKQVVVVSDNDGPGLLGAQRLQKSLPVLSCIWTPPAKDLREFLKLGGTRAVIESMTRGICRTKPIKKETP